MKLFVKKILLKLPIVRRYHFASNVHKELEGMESVLELGCGVHSYLSKFGNGQKGRPYAVGVDIYKPSADLAKAAGVYDEVFIMDAMNIADTFSDKSFDCIMAMDFIEHLNKEDGLKLLAVITKIAKKKIILYTPNGFLEQGPEYGNPWQQHLSGWSAQEMSAMGYQVTGWGGLKSIRPRFLITRQPIWFWKLLQGITQLYTRSNAAVSFQILCVKDLSQ